MTLVTGTVQDLGYDGMEGTLWARPARFRSDGSVVYAPERKPFTITGGVVSAELAPGPAVLELQVGSHARGTFEVVIPDTDITLADLLDTVFPWEPAQVSQFVAERELAVQAKTAAETAAGQASTAAGTATTAAQQTGQDRTAVAADKQVVVGHVQALAAPNDAAVLGLISEGATTQTKAALNATYATKAEAGGGPGVNLGRFLKRAQAGEDLKVVLIGDSVLEGNTVDNPATQGTGRLLATDLTARFPGTITVENFAVSGYTAAASFINGKVRDAVAASGDLYLIAFGKNDGGWEREPAGERPVPGYPQAASIAMLEQMVRLVRADVPQADIILMAENPYTPIESTANTILQGYNAAMKALAASYGVEFVDAYTPFATAADPAALIPDGTHPGTAGHRLMADTILTHLPETFTGITVAPPRPDPTRTMRGPQIINTTGPLRGWTNRTTTGGGWSTVGAGWTGPGPYTTSTPGDYAEFDIDATELLLTVSTLAADGAVVDVEVDGALYFAANRALTNGKQGSAYLVPFATGLTPGRHTVRITLVSGTLKIHSAAWTNVGTGYIPDVVVLDLGAFAGEVPLDASGGTTYLINNASAIPLPAGWSRMDVVLSGYIIVAVKGETTTDRLVNCNLRTDLVARQVLQKTVRPVAAGAEAVDTFAVAYAERGKTAATGIRFEVRAQGADKTNVVHRAWGLQATCYRTA